LDEYDQGIKSRMWCYRYGYACAHGHLFDQGIRFFVQLKQHDIVQLPKEILGSSSAG